MGSTGGAVVARLQEDIANCIPCYSPATKSPRNRLSAPVNLGADDYSPPTVPRGEGVGVGLWSGGYGSPSWLCRGIRGRCFARPQAGGEPLGSLPRDLELD